MRLYCLQKMNGFAIKGIATGAKANKCFAKIPLYFVQCILSPGYYYNISYDCLGTVSDKGLKGPHGYGSELRALHYQFSGMGNPNKHCHSLFQKYEVTSSHKFYTSTHMLKIINQILVIPVSHATSFTAWGLFSSVAF